MIAEAETTEWSYNEPDNPVVFDFDRDFDEQVKEIRSVNGGRFVIGSHAYFVLKALFEGEIVDDYANRPTDFDGFPVHNVRNRISELRHRWNVKIGVRKSPGKKYVQYKLYGTRGDHE